MSMIEGQGNQLDIYIYILPCWYVDVAFDIIPVEVKAAIQFSVQIYGDFIMFFDGDDYVVLVFFEEEFYAKVFYTEVKSVIASFVVLEAWVLCEFVEKLFKGDDAG